MKCKNQTPEMINTLPNFVHFKQSNVEWCIYGVFFSIQKKFGSFCKILDLGRCYSTHFVFGPLIILQFDLTEQKNLYNCDSSKYKTIIRITWFNQKYVLKNNEMMLYLVNQWHIHKYVNWMMANWWMSQIVPNFMNSMP